MSSYNFEQRAMAGWCEEINEVSGSTEDEE
jgi:hypothetical protein